MHHASITQCSDARPKRQSVLFCRALAFVWPQYCDRANPVHKHISQTLRLVRSLSDIAGAHAGLFRVPEDKELIFQTAARLIAHYKWLAKWAQYLGLKRWNTVLKHHYAGHLALPAQWLH